MKSLITTTDQQRIEETIHDVEKNTSAEIVVAVVSRSSGYTRWRFYGTVLLTLAVMVTNTLVFSHSFSKEQLRLIELLSGIVFWFICGHPRVLMALTPDYIERIRVHQRAMQLFVECGVYATEKRTGVLIMFSELERRVEILGDTAIHKQVGQSTWETYVNTVISSIKMGKIADGLCDVIVKIGAAVQNIVPVDAHNRDELPNSVIRVS